MIPKLIKAFEQARNPKIGEQQAAYMKNHFPFLGLKTPLRRSLQKELFTPPENLPETLITLWELPEREYTYAALDLAQKYRKRLPDLSFIRELIEKRSWWDSVDPLASNILGYWILQKPSLLQQMDAWIEDPNFWIRRSALICQLKAKEQTDAERLFSYCKKTAHESEFFIRKAIGWALREYSKTAPEKVARFINENRASLSPLSIREGSKYCF